MSLARKVLISLKYQTLVKEGKVPDLLEEFKSLANIKTETDLMPHQEIVIRAVKSALMNLHENVELPPSMEALIKSNCTLIQHLWNTREDLSKGIFYSGKGLDERLIITSMGVFRIYCASEPPGEDELLILFSYFSLIRETKKSLRYLGFILPLQGDIILADLKEYDHAPLFKEIRSMPEESMGWGYSISLASLEEYPALPFQVFIRNPRAKGEKYISAMIPSKIEKLVREKGARGYVHSPYTTNLSNPDEWLENLLRDDMILCSKVGFRGMVIHVGHATKRSRSEALKEMVKTVKRAIPHISSGCPLMIETPCGAGTELLSSIEEMRDFFNFFTPEEKEKLSLCVDTCHVFVAGYEPMEYITKWLELSSIPIGLIHFNDSEAPKGTHKDRHTNIGLGCIGEEELLKVFSFAQEHDIDTVRE